MKDVAIIGGGIAGLNAAYRLLQIGHGVTVYEKQRGSIDKVCGEGMLPFGVALLEEMGFATAVRNQGQAFHGLAYHYKTKCIEASFPNNRIGIGVDRSRLDKLMRSACQLFPHFTYVPGHRGDPEEISKRHAIILGADGVQGQTGRWLGRKPLPSNRLGARFRISAPALGKVAVYFFPEGEIYLTPTQPNTISVAMLLNRRRLRVQGRDLKAYCLDFFAKALRQYASSPIRDFAMRGHIDVRWRGPTPRRILIGDALRAYDPIGGAGMSFALLCGKMAATHLEDVAGYYRSIRRTMAAVGSYTGLIQFFSGGGWRTGLMFRQLSKAPAAFERLLASHDGQHRLVDILDWQMAKQILRG